VHGDGTFVGELRNRRRTSRWRGGPTILGPAGRVLGTAAVLLFGPWGSFSVFTLLYGPVWMLVSVVVLKEIWRPQVIDADAPATRGERFRASHPILAVRLDGRVMLVVGMLVLFVLSVSVLGTGGRSLVFAIGGVVGLGFLLAWLSGY
jgi:hypothetical protein